MTELLTRKQLVDLLKARTETMTLRAAAVLMGVSHQAIDKALKGDGPLGKKIPAALGYEAVTYYKPIHNQSSKKVRTK